MNQTQLVLTSCLLSSVIRTKQLYNSFTLSRQEQSLEGVVLSSSLRQIPLQIRNPFPCSSRGRTIGRLCYSTISPSIARQSLPILHFSRNGKLDQDMKQEQGLSPWVSRSNIASVLHKAVPTCVGVMNSPRRLNHRNQNTHLFVFLPIRKTSISSQLSFSHPSKSAFQLEDHA